MTEREVYRAFTGPVGYGSTTLQRINRVGATYKPGHGHIEVVLSISGGEAGHVLSLTTAGWDAIIAAVCYVHPGTLKLSRDHLEFAATILQHLNDDLGKTHATWSPRLLRTEATNYPGRT